MTAKNRLFTRLAAEAVLGEDAVKALDAGSCPMCKKPVDPNEFRDRLSRQEYGITGLCQTCQDQVFAPAPDEE